MPHAYTVSRSARGGTSIETDIPLGEAFPHRHLKITTHKWTHGITCSALVVKLDPDNPGCYSYALYKDFSRRLGHDAKARATEKALRTMHEKALEGIEAVLADARTQYATPPAAEAA